MARKGPNDDMGPVSGAVLCYRFTVGYYSYQVWQTQEPCPRSQPSVPGGFATTATAEDSRVQAAENAISELPPPALAQIQAAPASLSQAAHLLDLDRHAHWVARILILPITASEFTVGHGRAALALRLRAGGCVYLSLPDNPDGGLPGPWLSPVHAPCTGAAALAASGWTSVNPTLGG